MLAWGIVIGLCLAIVCQGALLRKKIRALETRCAQLDGSLEETAHALEEQKAQTDQCQSAIDTLQGALAEKEAALEQLSAPPKPKLYLPDTDALASDEITVYYNENTGIYHADRFCAPYQAIETPLSQVPPQARPCKKCAEGVLPPARLPDDHPQEEENQLSLFELSEIESS